MLQHRPSASANDSPEELPPPGFATADDDRSGVQTRRVLRIVLAEDNPGDVFLVREALELHQVKAELTVQKDGEDMLEFIRRLEAGEAPRPDLVLLDLNLPKFSGAALLKRLRESPRCAGVPVVIVTSSDSAKDREETARLGASSYFRKPPSFDEFMALGALVKKIVTTGIV